MAGGDRVYTEADLANFKEAWERQAKEREWSQQLANLTGQVQAMREQQPDLIRSISREVAATVVRDVLQNQKDVSEKRFGVRWERWAVSIQLTLISLGLIYEIFFKH